MVASVPEFKGDAGCARNFPKGGKQDSHTVAHKERPKGDAWRRSEASYGRRNPQRSVLRETQGAPGIS
ncbi:unnamed protein product [Prunus armeniaca]